jgi:triacylglycerol esterase/lipase EstA (alpha/beta hydrolase family)
MPIECKDMIVLLPGIGGSILQKDGKDVWAPSAQAAWSAVTSLGGSLQGLRLEADDPTLDDLGDGISAPHIAPDVHIIPGLVKIDGYSGISNMIMSTFKVEKGNLIEKKPANYFEFPYDWRRDNRVSARKLKHFIDERLHLWRNHTGDKRAKVILMAHSMGGLVSRHYLEVLEGWRECKALITFGTPYRGSVNALNYLANGYKQLFVDLTEMLRSFTSVHQLLPIYEMLAVNGYYQRVAETKNLPGVNAKLAEAALRFHRDIEVAVEGHQSDQDYRDGFKLLPILGTQQPTLQSASLENGKVTVSGEMPSIINANFGGGDGTVPRVSATPIELSDEWRDTFVVERHASLQNNSQVLDDLRERLITMQTSGLRQIRGSVETPRLQQAPALSLELDDLYTTRETVTIWAKLLHAAPHDFGDLKASLTSLAKPGQSLEQPLTAQDDTWTLTLRLEPGSYRVSVRTSKAGGDAPNPVSDVFEVIAL